MELWIRSQDKKILQQVKNLYVATYSEERGFGIYDLRYDDLEDIDDCDVPLGFYKSKERALEVLDEIQRHIAYNDIEISSGNACNISYDEYVYEMPKE
jgi:hypothetical protein